MLKVKENYSSKHVDKSCRFCKTQESETQTHILEKCKEFETEAKYIDQNHLKKATEHITKIEAKQILQITNKISGMDRTKTQEAIKELESQREHIIDKKPYNLL